VVLLIYRLALLLGIDYYESYSKKFLHYIKETASMTKIERIKEK
jgi:hypothetical protein